MVKVDYKLVGKMIIKALQEELIGQGHEATGNLIKSFEQRVVYLPKSVVMEILMDDYGIYVNEGREKKKKKVPLDALIKWIEQRAIANGDKEVKSMAFAIQQNIWAEGSPTAGSFKYSKNGRRKGFIEYVIDHKLDNVYDELEKELFEGYETAISSIIKQYNQKG